MIVRRHRHPLLAVFTALVLIGVGASCGLSEDSSPRAIAADDLPAELTDRPDITAPIPPGQAEMRQIYLVTTEGVDETSRLVAVDREMRRTDNLEAQILASLRSVIAGDDGTEYGTYLPGTLVVNGVQLTEASGDGATDGAANDDPQLTLTIDLNGDLANVNSPGQALAYAQLVFTATQFPGVENVRFTDNGETANAVDGAGESVGGVTRASYSDFAPAPD